jgi:hypothetical protein
MKITQERLIELYREVHIQGHRFHGTSIKGRLDEIGRLLAETGCKSLLDYGCGKAIFYKRDRVHEKWGVTAQLYDPGVKEFDQKPDRKFDAVVCTDVLEHILEPEKALPEIIGYAEKLCYLAISCAHSAPAKRFSDGTPYHVSVHPPEWWMERIQPFMSGPVRIEVVFS